MYDHEDITMSGATPHLIVGYIYCAHCMDELPEGESLESYEHIQVGLTEGGAFQVWCTRHDCSVVLSYNLSCLIQAFNTATVEGTVLPEKGVEHNYDQPISIISKQKSQIVH